MADLWCYVLSGTKGWKYNWSLSPLLLVNHFQSLFLLTLKTWALLDKRSWFPKRRTLSPEDKVIEFHRTWLLPVHLLVPIPETGILIPVSWSKIRRSYFDSGSLYQASNLRSAEMLAKDERNLTQLVEEREMMIVNKTLETPVAVGKGTSSTDPLAEIVADEHPKRDLVINWS